MKLTIGSAEHQIAGILARLEADTGETVESIGLSQIEVTQIESERPEFAVRVAIQLFRTPGHRWAV
jgi:hypothetical protein